MYLRVINTRYDLVEFNLFVTEVDGKTMNVLEMLIDYPLEEFDENMLDTPFSIVVDRSTYVFSGFTINEFYEEKELLKVVCVK